MPVTKAVKKMYHRHREVEMRFRQLQEEVDKAKEEAEQQKARGDALQSLWDACHAPLTPVTPSATPPPSPMSPATTFSNPGSPRGEFHLPADLEMPPPKRICAPGFAVSSPGSLSRAGLGPLDVLPPVSMFPRPLGAEPLLEIVKTEKEEQPEPRPTLLQQVTGETSSPASHQNDNARQTSLEDLVKELGNPFSDDDDDQEGEEDKEQEQEGQEEKQEGPEETQEKPQEPEPPIAPWRRQVLPPAYLPPPSPTSLSAAEMYEAARAVSRHSAITATAQAQRENQMRKDFGLPQSSLTQFPARCAAVCGALFGSVVLVPLFLDDVLNPWCGYVVTALANVAGGVLHCVVDIKARAGESPLPKFVSANSQQPPPPARLLQAIAGPPFLVCPVGQAVFSWRTAVYNRGNPCGTGVRAGPWFEVRKHGCAQFSRGSWAPYLFPGPPGAGANSLGPYYRIEQEPPTKFADPSVTIRPPPVLGGCVLL
jgi:hypothetical protein